MSAPVKQRCEWIDAARCIAMVLILWLHAGGAPEWLGGIVGGSICFFFMLAGYFMPRDPARAAKRACRLALAWLLWSVLSAILFKLAQPNELLEWQRVIGWEAPAYNTPLWFLRNLFLYQFLLVALVVLRVLPRYKWPVLFLLCGFCYAAEPAQHLSLRFDWFLAALLGYNLHDVSLPRLRELLAGHAWVLLALGLLLFLQREYYPEWLAYKGVRGASCSLPVMQLCWAVCFALAAVGIERCCKRLSHAMAQCGSCMLFIYAAHSLAFAPFYILPLPAICRFALMMLVMVFLALLARYLQRVAPTPMRFLMAK